MGYLPRVMGGESPLRRRASPRASLISVFCWLWRRLLAGRARQSGAFRVYEDPADLLRRIDEVGGRR